MSGNEVVGEAVAEAVGEELAQALPRWLSRGLADLFPAGVADAADQALAASCWSPSEAVPDSSPVGNRSATPRPRPWGSDQSACAIRCPSDAHPQGGS